MLSVQFQFLRLIGQERINHVGALNELLGWTDVSTTESHLENTKLECQKSRQKRFVQSGQIFDFLNNSDGFVTTETCCKSYRTVNITKKINIPNINIPFKGLQEEFGYCETQC